jgi:hypothetical protein
MCVDCVLALSRIAQVDPGDEPLPEVVLLKLQGQFLFAMLCVVSTVSYSTSQLNLHLGSAIAFQSVSSLKDDIEP